MTTSAQTLKLRSLPPFNKILSKKIPLLPADDSLLSKHFPHEGLRDLSEDFYLYKLNFE
jgi:hypothetical protein